MDALSFDSLSKTLSGRLSRRGALSAGGGLATALLGAAAHHSGRSGPVGATLHLARAVVVGVALLVPSLSAAPPATAQDLSDCDVFSCSGSDVPPVVGTDFGPTVEPEAPLVAQLPDELPAVVDSDGDGFFDADEIRFGSDPLSAGSTPWVGPDPIPEPIVEPAPDVSGGGGGGGGGPPEFIIEPSCITEPDECFLPRVLAEDETTD